jgi:predicted Zn-dependent peptidase
MQKEKGVIVEEIRMYNDLPQKKVQNVFMELLYGDQPAGWDIAGTEDNVRAFTREQIIDYRNKHYVAGATTVIVSGSFDESSMLEMIEKYFANIPTDTKHLKEAVRESQSLPQVKIIHKETDQTHMVLGVRTFPISDDKIPVVNVLSTILGRGMSSRLFSKMRDQLGICYYIKADNDAFTDHGVLSIVAGVDNSRVEKGIEGILDECRRLRDEVVPQDELKKAKDYISGTTMLELETSDARAEFLGYQELVKGKIESPEELMSKINAVTAQDVMKLAKEIFVDDKLNLAMIGKSKHDTIIPCLHF